MPYELIDFLHEGGIAAGVVGCRNGHRTVRAYLSCRR
jgi:hypothetical protein